MKPDHLAIQLSAKSERDSDGAGSSALSRTRPDRSSRSTCAGRPLEKDSVKTTAGDHSPASTSSHPDPRPIRAETRAKLVTAIAKGRHWLDELIAGTVTNVEQIAAAENCTVRQINMTISLAFLAPNLVQAAVDGRLPRGVGIANLRDAPAEWSRQYARLGLASRSSVGITAPGTEFSRPETRPRIRHIPPAGDRIAKITRRIGRANAGLSRKVSVIRDSGNCVVGPGEVPTSRIANHLQQGGPLCATGDFRR